jgi:hypothetical protein
MLARGLHGLGRRVIPARSKPPGDTTMIEVTEYTNLADAPAELIRLVIAYYAAVRS